MQQTNLPEQMFSAVEVLSMWLRNVFNGLIKIKIDLSSVFSNLHERVRHSNAFIASLSEVNGFLGAAFLVFVGLIKMGGSGWLVAQSVCS